MVKMCVSTRFPARPPIARARAGGLRVTAARMMGLISGWVRKPMGSLRGEGTGLLRPNRLDNWSRAIVATLPVRTSTKFWMMPLLSLLLVVGVVVEVKASTKAVVGAGDAVVVLVVAGDAVVVLAADDVVVVLVVESPPSRPKPKRPPSGAAETMQRRGRRLSNCILKAFLT